MAGSQEGGFCLPAEAGRVTNLDLQLCFILTPCFKVKRAIKFLRRDSVDMVKINEMLEIDRQNDSSDESDHDSNYDSR